MAPSHAGQVVVDCDPGIDDALALLALAGLARRNEVRVALVTTVRGNVSAQRAAANARYILDQSALSGTKVLSGSNTGLSPETPSVTGPVMHGSDGLGGLAPAEGFRQFPDQRRDAVDALANRVRDGATILSLAPLTNVARALPRLPGRDPAAKIVVMGGAFGSPAGNVTPFAEFNFALDPVAARAVLMSALDVLVVPLDVTRLVTFGAADVEMVRKQALNPLTGRLLQANLDTHRRELGLEHCCVHDAVALMAMISPELTEVAHGQLKVATEGERAGNVSLVRGTGNGAVAVKIAVEQVKLRLLELWISSPGPTAAAG